MLKKEKLFNEINILFSTLITNIIHQNQARNFDINQNIQPVLAEILNIIYDLNLVDLDRDGNYNYSSLSINQPAIDLGDRQKGVCFQITTDNSLNKIKDTLKKFNDHKLYETYVNLMHLIIGEKKKYRGEVPEFEDFDFSFSRNVIDTNDMIKVISDINDINKLKNLRVLLQNHINNAGQIISYSTSLDNIPTKYPDCYSGILEFMGNKEGDEGYEQEKINVIKFINKFNTLDFNIRGVIQKIIEVANSVDDQGINFTGYPLSTLIENDRKFGDTLYYMHQFGLIETPDDTGTDFSRLSVNIEVEEDYRIDYLNIIVNYSKTNQIPLSQWIINMDFTFLNKL